MKKFIIKYAIRSLLRRKMTTFITALSFALVIATLIASLSVVKGIEDIMQIQGNESRFFAISSKTSFESQSKMEDRDPFLIDGYDEIKINAEGIPFTSHEIVTTTSVGNKVNQLFRQIIRGIDLKRALQVHNSVRILQGRFFNEYATNEVILGIGAKLALDLKVGQQIKMQKHTWTIVGIFEDGGSPMESEIWTSRKNIEFAFRKNYVSSVWGIVKDPSLIEVFCERLNNEPQMAVYVTTENEYYARGASAAKLYTFVGWFVAIFLSIGAIFSTINTMFASIVSRIAEFGTLQVIGFQKPLIAFTLVFESFSIALSGSILACIIVYLIDGYTLSMNVAGLGKVIYQFNTSAGIFITGILFAFILGIISGIIPAKNILKTQITESLKES